MTPVSPLILVSAGPPPRYRDAQGRLFVLVDGAFVDWHAWRLERLEDGNALLATLLVDDLRRALSDATRPPDPKLALAALKHLDQAARLDAGRATATVQLVDVEPTPEEWKTWSVEKQDAYAAWRRARG